MWPFRRKARPPARESWQPGNVAECINDDWMAGPEKRPKVGDRAIVLNVRAGYTSEGPCWLLELLGFSGLWNEAAFRKVIVPPGDEAIEVAELAERVAAMPPPPVHQRVVAAAILVVSLPVMVLGTAGVVAWSLVDAARRPRVHD